MVQATAEALAAGVHEGVGSRSEDEVKIVVGSMAANATPKSTAEVCEYETNKRLESNTVQKSERFGFSLVIIESTAQL